MQSKNGKYSGGSYTSLSHAYYMIIILYYGLLSSLLIHGNIMK